MKKDPKVYLEDIKDSITKIENYTKDTTEDVFFNDSRLQDSVVRRLEIIGEAVKNLPSEFKKKHPKVPWREIAGMRDVLIHEYSGVNLSRVWKVIEEDLPELKKRLAEIFKVIK